MRQEVESRKLISTSRVEEPRIKTPNGAMWLTVPVLLKGEGFPLIRDVRINTSQSWAKTHLKTLAQYYSKAPYFREYHPELEELLLSGHDNLAELDREVLTWMCSKFSIATPLTRSSDLDAWGDRIDRLIAIVRHHGGNVFYEGAAGRDYIPVDRFEAQGVRVEFQDYQHPVYAQLHGPFVSHLSAIDLLFNHGPASRGILLGSPGLAPEGT